MGLDKRYPMQSKTIHEKDRIYAKLGNQNGT